MDDVKIGEILLPGDEAENKTREEKVKAKFWVTVKKAAGRVPFMEDVVAAYYCAMDTNTPARTRGILLAALAYFVLPTDLIPDFLAGFGFSDDVAVLTAALAALKSGLQPVHYTAARKALAPENADSEPQDAPTDERE